MLNARKKRFWAIQTTKKPQRPYQYAAHIYAFLQFNLATLEYVTGIAFIDAVMHFSAAFWNYTESSSLRWWINFWFILKVVIKLRTICRQFQSVHYSLCKYRNRVLIYANFFASSGRKRRANAFSVDLNFTICTRIDWKFQIA